MQHIFFTKSCLLFQVFLFLGTVIIYKASGKEAILLDTRTALSDLGWTMSQGSEWQEMSGSDKDGNERRMLAVCQIKKPDQNNWMRTQYIPVQGARRVYVEVEFTIRSCEDVPNVASCKETFNLFYYETDRDEASSTFPPWKEGAYIKVDTIAADQRFQPGSLETNFETRDIGPITKNGIYLAVQDTGGCVALMHVRVYYKYCDKDTKNLATFTRTTAGQDLTSLVETKGSCVRNAITENRARPSLYCNGEGDWTVPSGTCVCTAGYEPNHDLTQCRACRPGNYKSTVANQPCKRCPDYSLSKSQGATLCDCMDGYFRAHSDDADDQCTKPPTKPVNAYSQVNKTSVTLKWSQPLNTGGRNDLTYRLQCFRCEAAFKNCRQCADSVKYQPDQTGLRSTTAIVSVLSSYAYYKFKICAYNGVTSVAKSSGQGKDDCVELRVETNQAAPSAVVGVHVLQIAHHSFVVAWDAPLSMNGPIQDYEVAVETVMSPAKLSNLNSIIRNRTDQRKITITGLESGAEYLVKVRARTTAGIGPFSTSIRVKTTSTTVAPSQPKNEKEVKPTKGIDTMLIAAICGGVVLVIVVIVALLCYRRRRAKKIRSRKNSAKKLPAVYNGSSVKFNRTFSSGHKTYIDPTTYEDPNRAVREFTKEIDTLYVKIEQVIGGGEFGEVCRGRLQLPNKPEQDIAIKTLKTGYSTQQKLDFLGEASIMGQFEHPNVIRLEGVVTRSRPLMIITEYMENGSLDSFLRNHDNEFTVLQLVGMLRNIAAGMKYLSDMGYVHRDLAARNILVNAQLVCKVSDFGMSRVLEEDSDAAYTARGGKIPIRWTAPEAFTFRKFTSASDVWSYGIVMWEVMSYGERPYWGMSNRDVMNAVETGYRLPAPMDCPEVQHRLMLECWKKDRNQRPKFGQIVSSLDKVLRDPSQLKAKVANERNLNGPNGTHVRSASTIPTEASNAATPQARTSATPPVPSATTDSGINEDTDEDAPMLRATETELKPLHQTNFSSLGVWLESIGFTQYKENFMRNGCSSLEQVIQLNSSDLARIGIVDENHQVSLLNSIQDIPPPAGHRQQPGLPTYTESMMMPPGISV